MSIDWEEARKDLKDKTARCDQIWRRGAPTCKEVAIYTFKYVYRVLSSIHTRTRFGALFKFFEMGAVRWLDWTGPDNFPLNHSDICLIWAASMNVFLLGTKKTR